MTNPGGVVVPISAVPDVKDRMGHDTSGKGGRSGEMTTDRQYLA